MNKIAATDYPVHDLIKTRWSPYAFSDRSVSTEELCSLFEAARWAPSSYNEQPWSYIVATKDDPEKFAKVVSCLVEGNQDWAKRAPVLMLGCTRLTFARNGKANAAAEHDLGLAAANLSLEASARGLYVHQMIGIQPERIRELYKVPEDVLPLTALAVGYAADPRSLPEKYRERDLTPRKRKPLSEFVFSGEWGSPSRMVEQQSW